MNNCKNKNGNPLNPLDIRDMPPHGNPDYSFTCDVPCYSSDDCKDIREGEFPFEGPNLVYGVCNMHKSYLIVKIEDDCEVKWNAVWPNGKTLIDTEGEYKVKYKWDACCELEPQFETVNPPCPCK